MSKQSIVRVNREFECPICAVRQPVVVKTSCRNCGVKLTLYAKVTWTPVIEETDDDDEGTEADLGPPV